MYDNEFEKVIKLNYNINNPMNNRTNVIANKNLTINCLNDPRT